MIISLSGPVVSCFAIPEPCLLTLASGGFRGGALGASAPPAESMVKKILTDLFLLNVR